MSFFTSHKRIISFVLVLSFAVLLLPPFLDFASALSSELLNFVKSYLDYSSYTEHPAAYVNNTIISGSNLSFSNVPVDILSDKSVSSYFAFGSRQPYRYLSFNTTYDLSQYHDLMVAAYISSSTTSSVTLDIDVGGVGLFSFTGSVYAPRPSPEFTDLSSVHMVRLTRVGDSSQPKGTVLISVPDFVTFDYFYVYDLVFSYGLTPENSPTMDGGVYSYTVDPAKTEVTDFRDYVRCLYENLAANSYWPAVFYPYYTISTWVVENSVTYVVITISEYPLIELGGYLSGSFNYESYVWDNDNRLAGSQMTYVGWYSSLDYPIDFYYTNYYAPAFSPSVLYDTVTHGSVREYGNYLIDHWLGYSEAVPSEPVVGCLIRRFAERSDSRFYQSYYYITNYETTTNTYFDFEPEGFGSCTSSIAQGYMELYAAFAAAGGDADRSILKQILEKVTHIDDDFHDVFGETDEYEDDNTKSLDEFISQGSVAVSGSIDSLSGAVTEAEKYSGTINSSLSDLTSALGDEWPLLLSLMAFGIIAILLQKRTD